MRASDSPFQLHASKTILRNFLISVIGALLLTQSLSGAAADLYQIEVIVFSRPGGGAEEHSSSGQNLRYPLRVNTLQAAATDATSVGPWQLLPASARLLNNEEGALARRGFPILFHGAWRQPVDTATRAPSALINGGRNVGGHHELEGYITLSAENYLHAGINLWFSQFGTTATAAEPIALPPLPGTANTVASGNAPDNIVPDNTVHIDKLFVLQQNRKLRSGELHYFDHPRFSALVMVKPVEPLTQ